MDKPLQHKLGEIEPSYGTWAVLEQTFDLAVEQIANGVKGAFVECGVASGCSVAAMVTACNKCHDDRPIWAFDSFKGIPWAGIKDADQPGIGKIDPSKYGVLETSGVSAHSLEQVKEAFKYWGVDHSKVNFVEGWFEDTLPKNEVGDIALLRLDGDLYNSTWVCLWHLYPKLVKGGILIMDDWQLPGCRQAFHDYFLMCKYKEPELIGQVDYCPAFRK